MAALFSILLFFLPFLSTIALALNRINIPLGSSISTLDDKQSWVSPTGDFAFGFYPLPSSNLFLLAVWFHSIPQKTLVWTPGIATTVGSNPVQAPQGSIARLTNNGLVVYNSQGKEIWSTKLGSDRQDVAYASMLDTGNFVLTSRSSTIVWQSFDQPTDTLLPTQALNMGSRLTSSLTETNLSNGRFQLRLQNDGNLVLYPVAYPSELVYTAYWASDTVNSNSQLVLAKSGSLYLTVKTDTRSESRLLMPNNTPTGSEYYHRLTLDYDGVLRKYVYYKMGSSWTDVWFVPDNICTAISSDDAGSGACGFNSYCRLDTNKRPICECLLGYSFLDLHNKFLGCKQDVEIEQQCGEGEASASKLFDMAEMQGLDWPFADYEQLNPMNEDTCRRACLVDCLCGVGIYGDGSCWKKKLPLSKGRMDPSVNRKVFIKLAKANISSPSA